MARCPYGPHRLVTQGRTCRRCSGDIGLYVDVQSLPVGLYNQARRLAGQQEYEPAAVLLVETLRLRPDFAEALWLLAAVEAGRGREDEARARLRDAFQAGASVDLSWGEPKCGGPPPAAATTTEVPEDEPAAGGPARTETAQVAAGPSELVCAAPPMAEASPPTAANPQKAVGRLPGAAQVAREAIAFLMKKPSAANSDDPGSGANS